MSIIPPVKIVIADDQVMVAEGIGVMLEQQPDFNVIGRATDGEKLLQLLGTVKPHLVLLDLNMPVMDGFEACARVKKLYPEIIVVALTTYDDDKIRNLIRAAGAAGMLLKYTSAAQLAESLRLIIAGGNSGPFISSISEVKTEKDEQISNVDEFLLKHKISDREMEVIRHIAQGLNSEEIAQKLSLSIHTVKTHRKNVLEKLYLNNSVELISFIHKHKLL